jgi:thiamine biosynthesis lipoprotein ApbE
MHSTGSGFDTPGMTATAALAASPATHLTWQALGTTVHVLVLDASGADAARRAVAAVLDEVDATFSRFRDSELTRLNARPDEDVRVGPLLAGAIGTALDAALATDGAVDPTVGTALRAIGYDDDLGRIATKGPRLIIRLEPIPGWRAVRFDRVRRTVRLRAGVELDLGSTGKALAADLAADAALRAMGGGGVLVSLGGDIATAGSAPVGGWRVLTADRSDAPSDGEGEVVALHAGALATSSTTVRRWMRGGATLHHLVDPATGLPVAGPWRTVSVAAPSCVEANTAATAAIVKGTGGLDWLAGRGIPARLVSTAGAVRRVAGWPAPSEEEAS